MYTCHINVNWGCKYLAWETLRLVKNIACLTSNKGGHVLRDTLNKHSSPELCGDALVCNREDLNRGWDMRDCVRVSWNHRITKSWNQLGCRRPPRSPSPTFDQTPPYQLNHSSKCCLRWHLEHLPGWPIPRPNHLFSDKNLPDIPWCILSLCLLVLSLIAWEKRPILTLQQAPFRYF